MTAKEYLSRARHLDKEIAAGMEREGAAGRRVETPVPKNMSH